MTIQEHHLQTDNASGVGTIQLTLIKGGTYIVRASGIDRFGQAVIGSNRVTISDESDETKLRIFAERTKTEVGAAETLRIHSRLTQAHALVTFEGEGVIAYEVLALKSGMNPLQFHGQTRTLSKLLSWGGGDRRSATPYDTEALRCQKETEPEGELEGRAIPPRLQL